MLNLLLRDFQKSDGSMPFENNLFGTPSMLKFTEVIFGLTKFSESRLPTDYSSVKRHNIPVIECLGMLTCSLIIASVAFEILNVLWRTIFSYMKP